MHMFKMCFSFGHLTDERIWSLNIWFLSIIEITEVKVCSFSFSQTVPDVLCPLKGICESLSLNVKLLIQRFDCRNQEGCLIRRGRNLIRLLAKD